ncbi:MAG: Rdx family protein [Phycisphaerales bacterium]|nr:Rdx family protein [Phycisphaerales bacterium]
MADAIKEEFDVQPTLIEGRGGVFDVHADGKKIFSKHEMDRFPEHHEVLSGIAKLAGKGKPKS